MTSSVNQSKFEIDRKSGEIFVVTSLDYETDDVTEYALEVVAEDLGKPPKRK